MTEKTFTLENVNPLEIFGIYNSNLLLMQKIFPKLKLVARGNDIKVTGAAAEIELFENKFAMMLLHFEKFGKLTESDIVSLNEMDNAGDFSQESETNGVLVHGRNGLLIKAITPNQQKLVDIAEENDLVFAIGPAGTGKTYTAVAIAVRALRNKQVRRIILTRPAVEAGENLGFLPGDLREKLDPYMQPLYDALRDMIPSAKLLSYFEDGTIEIAPLAFMRGRTLDNAFVILDEAQNASQNQLKMFLTRMGKSAKFIVTGDVTQIDLPKNQPSGLTIAVDLLKNIEGIGFITLDEKDVVRHKLVRKIIYAFQKNQI